MQKSSTAYRAIWSVGLVLALAGCSTAAPQPSGSPASSPVTVDPSDPADPATLRAEKNKQLAQDFYRLAFDQRKPDEAAAEYLGSSYLQHNPGIADGAAGFVKGIEALLAQSPELTTVRHRVFAQGDLVGMQSSMTLKAGGPEQAVMDIFRFDTDGKIVEHWDAIQEVPAKSVSGRTMFDGPTEIKQVAASTLQRNTETVKGFLELAFNQAKAQQAVDDFVGAEYLQHNPNIADGGAAFVAAFAGASPLNGEKATKFPRFIAEGDFVMAQTFAPSGKGLAGSGSIDVFRLDANGKIVEHWDAVQDYPEKTVSGHTVWDDGE
ncbi:nuclear transport factor 2 family protein [Psychromicrobium sp. YIM B11713]|uniref:nuclear transport factor 2 family protein n=1 Tax=Psychromicrobium sp. YIM B11713 TaxID=3145233 RepID=UPI00374E5F7B